MIVNIRGTNGSGKSTIVTTIRDRFLDKMKPVTNVEQKILGYEGFNATGLHVGIVGRYETACGGCDTIKSQDEVVARVKEFAHFGNTVFEGVIVGDIYARYAELAGQYPNRFVFAFLDTPLEMCLLRVRARRLEAGKDPNGFNAQLVEQKWNNAVRQKEKALAAGLNVVTLNWNKAVGQVNDLLSRTTFS